MKTCRATHKVMTGMLLLLLVSFTSFGNIKVAAQDHHGSMNHSRSSSASDCQTRCSSIANVAALPQKENGEKEKEPQPAPAEQFPAYPFRFVEVKKLNTNPDRDSRLLRPPDILALNCIYRI